MTRRPVFAMVPAHLMTPFGFMHFPFEINWLYTASGFIVGALVGMTGVGGGSLMTPLLILLFGIHPATAVGTDLLYAAATKTAGTLVHGFARTIDWRIVGRLATGSVPTTLITIWILSSLGVQSAEVNRVITQILAGALALTSLALVFRPYLIALHTQQFGELPDDRVRIFTILTGAILGALVSLSSVGAGSLGVTVLILLYPKLPIARIVGSDITHAVPLTFLAGMGHWWLGSIDGPLLGSLLIGSIPGIMLTSAFVPRVPDRTLRYILAITLLAVAVRLVF